MISARGRCTSLDIVSTSAVHVVTLWGAVMGSKMKFSEAIREGIRKDGEQIFGNLFSIKEGKVVGCCALGAAALGVGMDPLEYGNQDYMPEDVMERLTVLYPFVKDAFTCPQCKEDSVTFGITSHLNDTHSWSRESIADFWEKLGQ